MRSFLQGMFQPQTVYFLLWWWYFADSWHLTGWKYFIILLLTAGAAGLYEVAYTYWSTP